MEQHGSHSTDFHEFFVFEDFSKIYPENESFSKLWQE
jgi:hypothetical protein